MGKDALAAQVIRTKSREGFMEFLQELGRDSRINKEEWENRDITSYLESIAMWVEAMEGYYENMNEELPTDINWQFLAALFYVGKIYE